jgi:hypothetical protein
VSRYWEESDWFNDESIQLDSSGHLGEGKVLHHSAIDSLKHTIHVHSKLVGKGGKQVVFHVASGCAPPKEKTSPETYEAEFRYLLHEGRFPHPRTSVNPENSGGWVWLFDPEYDVLSSLLACAWVASRRGISVGGIAHGSM